VAQLVQYREYLGTSIAIYQRSEKEEDLKFELPSAFFVEITKHHKNLMALLEH
jgi:hypothetical protein